MPHAEGQENTDQRDVPLYISIMSIIYLVDRPITPHLPLYIQSCHTSPNPAWGAGGGERGNVSCGTDRGSDLTSKPSVRAGGQESKQRDTESLLVRRCRLLCWVVLCLLGAVSMDTGITQIPKHLVAETGRKMTLKCKQNLGHNVMYWYKQSARKPLKLMIAYSYYELLENETVSSRFSLQRSDTSQLGLHVSSLEPEGSAVYLCASSQDTALHPQLLPVHKPPGSSQEAVGGNQVSAQHFLEDPRQRSQTLLLPVRSLDVAMLSARHRHPWPRAWLCLGPDCA
ncbi:uncharacterized protein LOC114211626 [Eumetopias jubatus]|uniref:uncharacterized protein LOC114211626 n=1 Tax=Eumetopias jubatus TaxID=34886 RepID=UPI001016AC3C|nr:uncharacterized protein LOC114211626 [Eumetopias jubatus]